MSPWLTLGIIVLVSIAFFADLRRNRDTELVDVATRDDELTTTPEPLVRPNVRDPRINGLPAATPRSRTASTRRAGRDRRS